MSDSIVAETTNNALSSIASKSNDLPPLATDRPPRVLIAGAGLGGLFLGILLERAGIPYEVFERSAELKPLGAIMSLSPNILPAFEQLGLYEELMAFSKPSRSGIMLTDKLKLIGKMVPTSPEIMGYERILFARPELSSLLFSKIPSDKIRMSKKVASFEESKDGITVTFEDGTSAQGDILVGADGTHSAVRQHLYKNLEKQGTLPKADKKEMRKGYISLVGTTTALDPAQYPGMLEEDSESNLIIGDKKTPYTWVTFTIPGNKICWNVVVQLGVTSVADEQFDCSDWVPQQNKAMMDSIRHFKTPYGTMGDLFDVTPIENVSKVYFEDKLFQTWNHGRTVLIGDAAHKLLPSSGSGAVNAMQDAVILANHIYDIKPTSFKNIKTALDGYKAERFNDVKEQYPQSYMAAKLMYGHTLKERILRHIVFNWTPNSITQKQLNKNTAYRPQANFLAQAAKRGTMATIPQQPSKRIQREKAEAKKKAANVPTADPAADPAAAVPAAVPAAIPAASPTPAAVADTTAAGAGTTTTVTDAITTITDTTTAVAAPATATV
ncbi:FAD/NAD(P)-binding domain-containing protein [Linnemannia elongata AG-77]|uniref:FAD/NAD(P)-binding domain-containing protein n=1 Tax=Linnemannia elongata AG-77 TaxID=1314771 RepID=A0A197JWP0_9FUNG|nr:FAD/NAD(P)-binding domain-containing protein [Linnemannia elongata AG-77]